MQYLKNKMKKYLVLLIIIFILGCKTENNIFFLFDRADGLNENSKVLFNGTAIGIVEEISIHTDYRILVKCKLNERINIPFDSEVKIKSTDILGSKSIYIESSFLNELYSNNDTIAGYFEERNLIDTILNKSSEIINNAIDEIQVKIDSLEEEIKKTNEFPEEER